VGEGCSNLFSSSLFFSSPVTRKISQVNGREASKAGAQRALMGNVRNCRRIRWSNLQPPKADRQAKTTSPLTFPHSRRDRPFSGRSTGDDWASLTMMLRQCPFPFGWCMRRNIDSVAKLDILLISQIFRPIRILVGAEI
jgi:hypothetical protein